MSEHGGAMEWDEGYCPYCGSWPAFVELAGGRPTLRCSFCALGWQLRSHRCLYCASADHHFVRAAPEGQSRNHIELCASCGHYTKVIEVGEPTPFPLLAIEDLATMDLDRAAMDKQYQRPDLPDLDAIEPLRSC
jgi:formate dehydrogenase maturation protein FdhE